MTTDTATNVDALLAEQSGIRAKIERAALEEDTVSWLELRMRADGLPRLIKDARTAPLRERLTRLEEELDALVAERERALSEEPPAAPVGMRGITVHMRRAQVLEGVNGRERQASQERKEVLAQMAAIEGGEGP